MLFIFVGPRLLLGKAWGAKKGKGRKMKAFEKIAVLKASEEFKDSREDVLPGVYSIDCMVHIKGNMKVGEDYPKATPQSAYPWILASLALSMLNETSQNKILGDYKNHVKAIMELKDKTEKETYVKRLEESVKLNVERSIADIKKQTKDNCKGHVKFIGTVEDVKETEANEKQVTAKMTLND